MILLEGPFQTEQLRRGERRPDPFGFPGEGAVKQQVLRAAVVSCRTQTRRLRRDRTSEPGSGEQLLRSSRVSGRVGSVRPGSAVVVADNVDLDGVWLISATYENRGWFVYRPRWRLGSFTFESLSPDARSTSASFFYLFIEIARKSFYVFYIQTNPGATRLQPLQLG